MNKNKTKEIIEKDIYNLIRDILDITFKKVDNIALNIGVEKNSIIRVKAAIIYIINDIHHNQNDYNYYNHHNHNLHSLLLVILLIILFLLTD